jgi:hypothetical protein
MHVELSSDCPSASPHSMFHNTAAICSILLQINYNWPTCIQGITLKNRVIKADSEREIFHFDITSKY